MDYSKGRATNSYKYLTASRIVTPDTPALAFRKESAYAVGVLLGDFAQDPAHSFTDEEFCLV